MAIDWSNLEEDDRQMLDYLEQLIEIWMLKVLLVRAQMEVRNTVEKANIVIENTYMNVTDVAGEDIFLKFNFLWLIYNIVLILGV